MRGVELTGSQDVLSSRLTQLRSTGNASGKPPPNPNAFFHVWVFGTKIVVIPDPATIVHITIANRNHRTSLRSCHRPVRLPWFASETQGLHPLAPRGEARTGERERSRPPYLRNTHLHGGQQSKRSAAPAVLFCRSRRCHLARSLFEDHMTCTAPPSRVPSTAHLPCSRGG